MFLHIIRDHPRTRGEYPIHPLLCSSLAGSPPHSRGILNGGESYSQGYGITPALAGNTPFEGGDRRLQRDHPRTRGEYSLPIAVTLLGIGITPALAGNTDRYG